MDDFLASGFFRLSSFQDEFVARRDTIGVWNELARRFELWEGRSRACDNPIPRIIHQIWIGGELPEKCAALCDSWRRMNPSYEYILWDERSILGLGEFGARRAYVGAKSKGAKSDIARYEILRRFGGVYADTDFECLRPFDDIVDRSSFMVGNMFAQEPYICNAIIGAAPGHYLVEELCRKTSARIRTTELMDIIEATGPGLLTRVVLEKLRGLEDSAVIFPSRVLYPYPNFCGESDDAEAIKNRFATDESYAIHYWHVSWGKVDFVSYLVRKARRALRKIRRAMVPRR